MRCPTLSELPPPPPGKTGWPWTEESEQLSDMMQDGSSWPKVSIVTPSYNQGQFIEETIRSVLLQGYPNLGYMVIDGGSTDGSVDIIREYEPWISYWVSEPDDGQTDAINKGWSRATGSYVTWLNSDDLLLPGSLRKTASTLVGDQSLDIVYGDVLKIDVNSEPFRRPYDRITAHPFDLHQMLVEWHNPVPQQGFLMRRTLLEQIGYLDEAFHFTLDFEYWVRIAVNGKQGKALPDLLAAFRHHEQAKSSTIQRERIQDRYRIFDKTLGKGQVSQEVAKFARQSRQNLERTAAYIAYRACDAEHVRLHASRYLSTAGTSSLPLVVPLFLLSFFGSGGLRAVHGMISRVRMYSSSR
jgi:glycosyltransferase involved in cell wall biosynthesis